MVEYTAIKGTMSGRSAEVYRYQHFNNNNNKNNSNGSTMWVCVW